MDLAVFVSAVTVVAVSYWRGWITATKTFWVALAAAAVLILGGPFIVHRFVTGAWGQDRIPLMLTAINMFKANWLFGVGANNYFFHIQQYLPVRLSGTWQYTVHNEYLAVGRRDRFTRFAAVLYVGVDDDAQIVEADGLARSLDFCGFSRVLRGCVGIAPVQDDFPLLLSTTLHRILCNFGRDLSFGSS